MSAHKRHKKGGHHEEEHENEERWLVSFADMMTLLFALFMVLFSISSVNTSKYEELQKSLHDAFSGAILSGGKTVMTTGSDASESKQSSPEPPLPALRPVTSLNTTQPKNADEAQKAAQKEENDFRALKRRIDNLSKEAGLQGKVKVTVRRRGLVIQMLTDKVFFDSGDAHLKPGAVRLVDKIGGVVRDEHTHPVVVEGHTDSQPISGTQYPSNWELSSARASAVVRDFIGKGVLARRVSVAGYANQEPIASNSTPEGRAENRRVEVVLTRINTPTTDTESTP